MHMGDNLQMVAQHPDCELVRAIRMGCIPSHELAFESMEAH